MTVRRWNIYRANLDPVVGSEQGKSRPVIVISEDEINNLLNTVNIIPITSRKEGRIIYPNEVLIPANNFGLTNESIALCHQIRTIDKKRMAQEYGHISDTNIQIGIIEAICFQVGIDLTNSSNKESMPEKKSRMKKRK